jgi:glycosyltransferase involved in cell wall biosynthesis
MKIAMIGSRGIHSSYGGIEKVLAQLCPRLAAMGHVVDVFSEDCPESRFPREDGVRSIPVRSVPGKYTETISRALLSTVKALRGRYDVINLVAIGPGILSVLPRLVGKPVVVSIHGLDWRRHKWPLPARAALRAAERVIVSSATAVTVVSRELQTYFREVYGIETVHTPNGVSFRDSAADLSPLAKLGLQPGGYVLFASRLVAEKGAHELIQAFAKVPTDAKLVIAGGGRYDQAYVNSLKSLDTSGRCVFTGHLSGAPLEAVFAGARLYVLPSHVEGLSLSLLEAMGHGRPTLVSDIPENTEVVGDCGATFRTGDVEALAAVLTAALSTPGNLASMGDQARDRARKLYSWDSVAQRYSDLYQHLAAQTSTTMVETVDSRSR